MHRVTVSQVSPRPSHLELLLCLGILVVAQSWTNDNREIVMKKQQIQILQDARDICDSIAKAVTKRNSGQPFCQNYCPGEDLLRVLRLRHTPYSASIRWRLFQVYGQLYPYNFAYKYTRWHPVGTQSVPNIENIDKLIVFCSEARSFGEMLAFMGLTDITKFRRKYIHPLLEAGILEQTIPNKPKSQNQKLLVR